MHVLTRLAQDGTCNHRGPEYSSFCGRDLKGERPQRLNFSDTKNVASAIGGICSEFYQDFMLNEVFDKIGFTNRFFVEFGARMPQRLNSAHFRLNCGWPGLLMDGAPGATPNGACPHCPDIHELLNAPDNAPVRLRQAFISMENVNDVFAKHNVPNSFDLLTIDIDSQDYWVLKGLNNTRFLPRVVCVEFSSYFDISKPFVPKYNPNKVWNPPEVTGSSLVALNHLMTSRGYSYVGQVAGVHAIFVLDSELHEEDRGSTPIPAFVAESWMWGNHDNFHIQNFERVNL